MFGPRTPRYPLLKAYLVARHSERTIIPVGARRIGAFGLAATSFLGGAVIESEFGPVGLAVMAVGAVLAWVGFRSKPPLPPTPEQELARRADAVVERLENNAKWDRLHRALHPAVAATMEECAGYQARIVSALGGDWSGRADLRESALAAAKVAMDEALVHAGETLDLVPEPRPLESLSDTLEDIGFGPLMRGARAYEPMPPAFRPVRDLAERLRELAVRCESAAVQRREESSEPVSEAFRRLDATLGELRHLEEAEGELRQGA